MKRSLWFSVCLVVALFSIMGCGGGGGSTTTPTGVDISTLNGATGVPINSNFFYNFSQSVNSSSVNNSSFFILPTPAQAAASAVKADINEAICNSENALGASVSCSNFTSCTLDPTDDLSYGTGYTICLTTDISYSTNTSFEGFMAQFTTETEPTTTTPEQVTLSSVKLVRLDGTELDLSARPIPRKLSIKFTLSHALTEEADRTAFEGVIALKDEQSNTVAGSFAWAADFASVVFTPTGKLEYSTDYTIEVTGDLPTVDVTAQVDTSSLNFTTLTHRDVNGDGYADVIVGATNINSGRGRAYILFGSASGISDCDLSAACTADATVSGTIDSASLGNAVYIGGDVNADGYEDIIVGQYLYDWVSTYGRVYVFHGGPSLGGALSSNTILTGPHSNDSYFGYSVSAGDVNGDGFDDVIVGAIQDEVAAIAPGGAYIFHGSTSGVATCDLSGSCNANTTIYGAADSDALGVSVSTAGDVNGDGYDDVIIGADGAESGIGNAYIFHGSASGISDCDLSGSNCYDTKIKGGSGDDNLGEQVASAGDINGDGYDDVIVGAYEGGPGTDRGQAHVLLGSASGVADCDLSAACTPRATISASADGDWLGQALHGGGDINGDGIDDIVVTALSADVAGTDRGRAYVFHGGSSLSGVGLNESNADATVSGPSDNAELGRSVFIAGDVNGDGYDDVIIGANRISSNKGKAFLFEGSSTGIGDCDLSSTSCEDAAFTGENNNDFFGTVRNNL